MSERKYYKGMTKQNSQGLWMTIIEYRSNKDITVQFEDGYIKKTSCDQFSAGTVRNPNRKKNYRTLEKERIGLTKKNDLGETMKIIEYSSHRNMIVEFQDEYRGQTKTSWHQWKIGKVLNPNRKQTGIVKHPPNFVDLTEQVFNNLRVICWDTNPPDEENPSHEPGLWKCECLLCGNYTWAKSNQITAGLRKECHRCGQKMKNPRKRWNVYDLSGEYGIGWTYNTNKPFYFDKEDYELIKEYSWKENNNGYIAAWFDNKEITMHRLIMNVIDSKIHIDHIKHNKADNRKSMLRKATCHENTMNKALSLNNKSGITGVCWEEESHKWHAYIWFNGKTIHLGRFENKEDAIKARIEAENKYFGEFGIHNSMAMNCEERTA